ncbi:MAG: hypothetical protein AB1595_00905 [bacterium]
MKKLIGFTMMALVLCTTAYGIGTSGTTAGWEIMNGTNTGLGTQADVPGDLVITYAQETGLGTLTDTATQTATATVGRIYGGTLTDAADQVGAPGGVVWYLYTIYNLGNASDDFNLGTDNLTYYGASGWTFEIYDLAKVNKISTIAVAEDGSEQFYLKVTIAPSASNYSSATVRTLGTTTYDGGSYTVGAWIYGGTDTVFDFSTTTVAAAIMKVSKTLEYETPSGYAGSNQFVPGGTITYIITYWNSGVGTASNVSVSDRIPNYTEYGSESLRMGTISSTYDTAGTKTDAVDGDEASCVSDLATFNIGQVGPGEGGRLYFRVRIK